MSWIKPPTATMVIKGAIIPHHLLASQFVIDLGNKLSKQNPKRIFIIGPKHDEYSKEEDHSCWAPREELKKILPNTEYICITLNFLPKQKEIDNLISKLISDKKIGDVYIASVDFSHYLNIKKASVNDLKTQKLLENNDINSLLKLNNDYLDSPRSIEVLWKVINVNELNMKIINHLNSAQIMDRFDLPSTTSYFEIIYN